MVWLHLRKDRFPALVGDLAEDLLANSTASIVIKPTTAFNCGDTFVFSSWVCTANSAGSFQRYLTMNPDLETRLVTLPEVVVGPLVEKFGKFSLCNQVANFEIGSNSNSNLTSPWIVACEPAPEPSRETTPLHEPSHTVSATPSGPMRKLSKHARLARRSPPSTPRTPTIHPATTRTLHMSSTSD
jgi:hypothetical protein